MSFEGAYWYVSIFLGLFLTGIGIPPIPEEIMITSAAAITAAQNLHLLVAWPAAVLGILCADSTLYLIGRFWGRRLFDYRWVQRLINAERRQRIERRFEAHGIKILLTARLLPPVRTGVFLIAGAIHYPFSRFLLADGVYAVFGVGLFFFGSQALISLLLWIGHWAVYAGGVVFAGFLLWYYYRHLRNRELRGPQPPISVLQIPAGDVPPGEPEKVPEAAASGSTTQG